MQVVVITGSTRGIGYGLADALLDRGCAAILSGRTLETLESAVRRLSTKYGGDRVAGLPCDVTDYAQINRLWEVAQERFGKIDIWINNAGLGQPPADLWTLPSTLVDSLVRTNLIGAMYGSMIAIQHMLEQGYGSLYNMEGLGSDGRRMAGLTLYGTTKYALRYLNQSLVEETRGTPVVVGALSPGMVVTDLLTGQFEGRPAEWERARRIFNILADRVETVAPWLARQIMANKQSGVRINWLTRRKLLWRLLTAPVAKRDLFSEQG